MARPWISIVTLWLLGVLAAAQLAKFATLAPLLRVRFDLSLAETGLLISLMEVGGGLLGFVAGLALGRVGCRRALLAGVALLAATGLAEALARDATLLFVGRALEGIAYLLVVIAAPTAIAALADARSRPRALALWSSFVPVGMAVGGAITSVAVGPLGASGTMALWAALLAAALLPAWRVPIACDEEPRVVLPRAAAWVATVAFGLYTLSLCALTMLLPTFLIERRGAGVSEAGLIAAVASFAALPAFVVALRLLRHGALSSRRTVAIAAGALVAAAVLAPLLFGPAPGLVGAGGCAVLVVGIGSIVSPLLFARLPLLAGADRPHDPRIASANGLLTQFGAGGALLGPPLGGLLVEAAGWQALGLGIAVLTLAMLAAVILAERLAPVSR